MDKIRSFRDLEDWREGHRLVLAIYETTKDFPREEKYGLTDQLRRAAVSVTSNIAEGFSRQSLKEKIQFYSMARGSNTELQNQILIAKDIDYLDEETFSKINNYSIKVSKLTSGLIKYCKS